MEDDSDTSYGGTDGCIGDQASDPDSVNESVATGGACRGRILHHRAFAAHRVGFNELRVVWDEDEMDWDAYRICVAWCRDVGVYTIHDLEARVISTEKYTVCWLDRCRAMQEALETKRRCAPGELYLPSG